MIYVPVSTCELVDKITILEIKLTHAVLPAQIANVQKELAELTKILDHHGLVDVTKSLRTELKTINQELWLIEDSKRQHEKQNLFDNCFIELARSVYIKNDIRASLKKQINLLTNSAIVEEKIY